MMKFTDQPILTVRIHAGLNADSFLAGLLSITGATKFMSAQELLESKFPNTQSRLFFEATSVQHIAGVSCRFETPHEHAHRTPSDIMAIYEESTLSEPAQTLAQRIWSTVAEAEAGVHGTTVDHVHFHEVGRMSNILAVGLIAELFAVLNPSKFVVSPIPMGDGTVKCAHGLVPNPAPATLAMLDKVTVRAFPGSGEAVTPTGLAVLLGLGAEFGAWPTMRVNKHVTSFVAGKIFENTANGSIFALGTGCCAH